MPRHRVVGVVTGNEIRMKIQIEQAANPVCLVFPEGTTVFFKDEGWKELDTDETILASWCEYYGEGMTTGETIQGVFFKVMNDPLEVTPVKEIKE